MTTVLSGSPTLAGSPTIPTLSRSELLELVTDLADSVDLWRPMVRFRAPKRYWGKLVTRPDVDVWLLTWLHDQRTEFHDHGESAAAFTVVEGAIRETRPAPSRHHIVHRDLGLGGTATVAPHAVHSVTNPHPEPAVSIHAYSPPLRHMTYYETGPQGLVAVRREVLTAEGRP